MPVRDCVKSQQMSEMLQFHTARLSPLILQYFSQVDTVVYSLLLKHTTMVLQRLSLSIPNLLHLIFHNVLSPFQYENDKNSNEVYLSVIIL